ncbi:unnamed protein product [Peniophora sp. CBMAI 1063]|nr:unnamed protein product [Peniophora sp. CBMAI 1063]
MDAIDPDDMLRYMSKELKAAREKVKTLTEQLEEERRKTRGGGGGDASGSTKHEEIDVHELREENEAQQKRLEVLEEENARLWHHVARFESGEEDKPIALDISCSDDRHTRLLELYYMTKDQHEAHCAKLLERVKSDKEKRDASREEARVATEALEAAKERAKAAEERADATSANVKQAEEIAETLRQRCKKAQSDAKASFVESQEAKKNMDTNLVRLRILEEAVKDLERTVGRPSLTPNLVQETACNHATLVNEFLGGQMIHPLHEIESLHQQPTYNLRKTDNRLGFTVPTEICKLLETKRQRGNGLWSVESRQARGFGHPDLSRLAFLAPSHYVAARETDGNYAYHPNNLWGDYDGRNRHIFYKHDQEWAYLGLYRSVMLVEFRLIDMTQVHGMNTKGLGEKVVTTKDMVPPLVVKHANQLWTSGAIRVVCATYERIEDDGGMSAALEPLIFRKTGLPLAPSSRADSASANGKRSFTGPPTPIPKPGQSSSAPPSTNKNNKRSRSGGSSSGPKNKKQKTKGGP